MASQQNQRIANTGKPSEQIFVDTLEAKDAIVFRMRDKADLYGLNKRNVAAFGQPSDYIVVTPRGMFFAEVKSSNNATSFPLGCLTRAQKAAATRCHIGNAGGFYKIYIHNMVTDRWYIMTGTRYVIAVKAGKKSIKWEDLQPLTYWLP